MRTCLLCVAVAVAGLALPGCGGGDPYDEAESLLARKRYSPAIVIYDQLLRENPNSFRAVMGRGRAYAASGETDKALEDFNRAVEIAPDQPEAFYRRAMLFEQIGEPGKARLDEEYAHSIDPQYREAFVAVENAMIPVVDEEPEAVTAEEGDEEVDAAGDEELAALPSGELTGKVSMREFLVLELPEPSMSLPMDESIDISNLGSTGATWLDWKLPETSVRVQLLDWRELSSGGGEIQSPAWMSRNGAAATTAKPVEKKQVKSPAPAQRPVFTPGATAPNPYVKVPVPVPGNAGSTPATTTKATTPSASPTGAGNTTRPTGSPFPQTPIRGTGR